MQPRGDEAAHHCSGRPHRRPFCYGAVFGFLRLSCPFLRRQYERILASMMVAGGVTVWAFDAGCRSARTRRDKSLSESRARLLLPIVAMPCSLSLRFRVRTDHWRRSAACAKRSSEDHAELHRRREAKTECLWADSNRSGGRDQVGTGLSDVHSARSPTATRGGVAPVRRPSDIAKTLLNSFLPGLSSGPHRPNVLKGEINVGSSMPGLRR